MAAAKIASAAFLAPPISTSPYKGFPPLITYCSIFHLYEFRSILPPNILFSIYTIVIHPTTNFIYDDVFKPPFVPVLLSIADTAATTIIL